MFEGEALMRRMNKYGLLDESQNKLDYVLALTPSDFLERRLQTLVFKLGLAKSIHHARVLIRQRHIRYNCFPSVSLSPPSLAFYSPCCSLVDSGFHIFQELVPSAHALYSCAVGHAVVLFGSLCSKLTRALPFLFHPAGGLLLGNELRALWLIHLCGC